jgi:hypothetical protein
MTAGQSLPGEGVSPGWHQRPYEAAELAEFEISTHHRRRVVLTVAVAVAVLLVAIGFLAGHAWPEEPDHCISSPLVTSAPLPQELVLDRRMAL